MDPWYLLDSNICIYYFKSLFEIDQKINAVGMKNCLISEITVAELKYGAVKSNAQEKSTKILNDFLSLIQIVPIFSCLDTYAHEKARLRKSGLIIDDFDLLIGATAIANDLVLVTNNEKHFSRLDGIKIENWAKDSE